MAQTGKLEPARRSVGDRRREAIIAAAYTLFTERGYESVSIDDIIRIAGGSKATLYKFYGNKEGVLRAVVESLAEAMLREFKVEFPSRGTARETLLRIGTVLADLALSDKAINQHRHAVAHGRAFPEVARLWFESGPSRTMAGIAAVLKRETEAGRLRVADPLRAAWHFSGMIIFQENMRRLVGLPPVRKAELRKHVEAAVDLFLAAYEA